MPQTSPQPAKNLRASTQTQTNSAKHSQIADEAIAKRAYEKFLARGSSHGHDQEDWDAARQELINESGQSQKQA
jgi:hypothetical protein